jgi:hypothetical protein
MLKHPGSEERVVLRAALLQALDNATAIQGLLSALPRSAETAKAREIADNIIIETSEVLGYGFNDESKGT